ncbi:hypothetical protein [Microbacterium sp. JB110]|uniref:hypothetical protein n=1 Tax=Microbacterium sp. JB110 TaxID=2024477 RepID=UPI0021635A3F|nr:hypothetical protein [Microbacterium sp. JB110]
MQQVTVALTDEGGFARAMNVIATATAETRGEADFDTARQRYAREELEKVSLSPGSTFSVGELEATWPASPAGYADAVRPDGQTIRLPFDPTTISFVGARARRRGAAEATVAFDDGSTQDVPLELGDWVIPDADGNPVCTATPWSRRCRCGTRRPTCRARTCTRRSRTRAPRGGRSRA